MTRSMAVHECDGLASCSRCLEKLWNGRTPVTTPALDRIFNFFAGVVIGLAFVYLMAHIVYAVVR